MYVLLLVILSPSLMPHLYTLSQTPLSGQCVYTLSYYTHHVLGSPLSLSLLFPILSLSKTPLSFSKSLSKTSSFLLLLQVAWLTTTIMIDGERESTYVLLKLTYRALFDSVRQNVYV